MSGRRDLRAVVAAALLSFGAARAEAAPGDTCATAVDVAALPFLASGTTCGGGNDFANDTGAAAVCTDLPRGYGGEDVFYKLTLQAGNRLAFDLTYPPGATGDLALFLVRQPSCADPPVCAGTSVDLIGAGVGPERIKQQSYPDGTYYLVVDSALGAPDPAQCGAYNLAVTGHLSEFCGNGIVETGEVCDDGNSLNGDCCAADCKSKAVAGTTCRAPAGACDQAEVCDGNGTCPADQFLGNGTVCRPLAGNCDLVETCTGAGPLCPADRVVAIGPRCRAPAGPCDQPEFCDGIHGTCPADQMVMAGTVCALPTNCTVEARCAGAASCPPAPPRNCDDGNSCTQDSCDPNLMCVHLPICQDAGADAASDARADGPTDAAPDRPADVAAADAPALDLRAVQPDAAPPADVRTDAARDVPAAETNGLAGDAARVDEPMPLGPQTLPDGAAPDVGGGGTGPTGMGEAGDSGASGMGLASDAGLAGDVANTGDGPKPINNLNDGCSCRVGAASRSEEGLMFLLPGLALVVGIARRRRPPS